MLKKKLGFTLIELLAVVLIIGILTSAALPKYRRTIERATATEALIDLRALFDSAKRYRAATSQPPNKLKGLDISFFNASSQDASSFSMGKYEYTFSISNIHACRIGGNYCFYFYYNHNTLGRDALTCKLTSTGGKYDWLCELMGGTSVGDNEYEIE